MHFLVQTKPYPDEALESYLLRLARDNSYNGYSELADILWQWLVEQDHELEGALPLELSKVDVYHARQASSFRIRALKLVAQLADVNAGDILALAWRRSNFKFGNLAAVSRNELTIPLELLRTDIIPVCIECLSESSRIPFYWHLKPYKACHKHKTQLTTHCKECYDSIDYRASEAFLECVCGCKLTNSEQLSDADFKIAFALASSNSHKIVGLISWFAKVKQLDVSDADFNRAFVDYFSTWPDGLTAELDLLTNNARLKQLNPFNKTKFNSVYGNVICDAQIAATSNRKNKVIDEIINYFVELVDSNPKAKHPNIADLLLCTFDAAVLLNTTTEQVYRFHQEGFLNCAYPQKKHEQLRADSHVFYLRQVIELQQAFAAEKPQTKKQFIAPW
ncbi:TniQ family protein [Pseudoalteromonas sp. CST5]|uniref:TniQ family protein n=1 Tax=unclassified Pseudoalteromonas TaxID=194690 RepID=UPI00235922C4|nr:MULTISPECIES: TniQ family protein [unclassified Pseudoalteromonas]MDC9515468.1 TniQ family protein [Pseudoalteromonas sp. CST1]MDC9539303.1 TniQ family protein [Pseudoalteromonas sp. CST3]MDC9542763.1 TniQ family protein [Pseudoalteromonas sp. CST2]MDC9546878.1 TniQ family protein [Pseudoalteromonas sp. CST4]MDC9550297.1 TniQ family protein [Pseudoalteromonas sp. CST5]